MLSNSRNLVGFGAGNAAQVVVGEEGRETVIERSREKGAEEVMGKQGQGEKEAIGFRRADGISLPHKSLRYSLADL